MEACHAAWRVGRIRTPVALDHGRAVFLGDDLFACQPVAEAIQAAGGNFILICKPLSHQTVSEYLSGAKLDQNCEMVCKRAKRTAMVYRGRHRRRAGRSWTGPLEDRERDVQCSQVRRLQPRAQFRHRKNTLASVLVVLNLLAFAYHAVAVAALAVSVGRAAVVAKGATYRFFEHLRTITIYVVFQDWAHLLRSIAEANIRPS